jgi:hypothetical protein
MAMLDDQQPLVGGPGPLVHGLQAFAAPKAAGPDRLTTPATGGRGPGCPEAVKARPAGPVRDSTGRIGAWTSE